MDKKGFAFEIAGIAILILFLLAGILFLPRIDLDKIKGAVKDIKAYKQAHGSYPEKLEDLGESYAKLRITDQYGTEYKPEYYREKLGRDWFDLYVGPCRYVHDRNEVWCND